MRQLNTLATVLALGIGLAGTTLAVAEIRDAGSAILVEYTGMHSALAVDSGAGVADHAARIVEIADGVEGPDAGAFRALAKAARRLEGEDLEALRAEFKEFSRAMATFVNEAGLTGAELYYCPMADGYWIQKAGEEGVRNPYYGSSMLNCGSKVDAVREGQ